MNDAVQGLISVAIAITGIAVIAVLVSKQAQTPEVIRAASGGFAEAISAAVSPITGGSGIGYGGSGFIH